MIYLAQTDTTAGFLSKDFKALNRLKNRPENTPCLIATAYLSELLTLTRVPRKFKNCVRKAKKTTFIYPNAKAIRVVKEDKHAKFLAQKGWLYSSSANLHGQTFDEKWARKAILKSGGVAIDESFNAAKPSKIFKLSKSKKIKIR